METICREIVELLNDKNKTISFMESCTGGFLANEITNISGASNVLKTSAVTYSNEYKIKFGVSKEIIEKYTVYSIETAKEMAKNISKFAKSDIGVGITGELGNTVNSKPKVYYAIYLANDERYIYNTVETVSQKRSEMKNEVAKSIFRDILENIKLI